jgi:hypothetical protein
MRRTKRWFGRVKLNWREARMTTEKQNKREKIEMRALTDLLTMVESKEETDLARLKAYYSFKKADQMYEAALKRIEIAGRKMASIDDGREFSFEETTEGIHAMLRKGESE